MPRKSYQRWKNKRKPAHRDPFVMKSENPSTVHRDVKTTRSHVAQEIYEGGHHRAHVPELTRVLSMRAMRLMSRKPPIIFNEEQTTHA